MNKSSNNAIKNRSGAKNAPPLDALPRAFYSGVSLKGSK